jgi:hypothetical protein
MALGAGVRLGAAVAGEAAVAALRYKDEAIALIRSGWKFANAVAKRHPLVTTILANLAFLDPDVVESIVQSSLKATGQDDAKPLDDIVRDLVVDETLQQELADKITTATGYDSFISQVPKAISAKIPDRTKEVLRMRAEKRKAPPIPFTMKYEPSQQETAVKTLKVIGSYFGARSVRQIMDLHAALRSFVESDPADIEETAKLIDILR